MMMIDQPGIYFDFDVAEYHADCCPEPSLTQSIAKILIERSPAHARLAHPRLAPPDPDGEDETPEKYDVAKAIGNAAHAYLIGRGKTIAVGDFPDWRKADAKAFREEALTAGRTPILAKHMVRATRMVEAASDQLDAARWQSAFDPDAGNGEVVIAWQEDGLWMRSLIDWLGTRVPTVYDYKSTGLSVAPHAIPNLMANAGWPIQAAMIERGLDALDPDNAGRRVFRFVAQENEPPYALTPIELGEAVLTMGRKQLQYAIDIWHRSMETGEWPAYSSEICRPEYPGFREAQWLTRETEDADRRRPSQNALMAG